MSTAKFSIYRAKDGYRWRLVAANGRIIAESGEAYTRERDAHRAVQMIQGAIGSLSAPKRPNKAKIAVVP